MEHKTIIDKLEVRDKQARAFFDTYIDYKELDELQKLVDEYSYNMAKSLLKDHISYFCKDGAITNFKQYLCYIKADKKHTGNRVSEAFYDLLVDLEKAKLFNNDAESEK